VITVVFAGIYLALYPGLGSHDGLAEVEQHRPVRPSRPRPRRRWSQVYAKYVDGRPRTGRTPGDGHRPAPVHQQLRQCHGSDARGSKGFPNLTDGDWLWGGDADIVETITEGRKGNDAADGRGGGHG
jgi:cytochrome c oxidase cbb3-type subunit 3